MASNTTSITKYLWKVKCTHADHSSNPFRRRWLTASEGTPTVCVDNDDHSIETSGVNAPKIEKIENKNIQTIDEGELTETGKFNLTHVAKDITSGVNSVTVIDRFWNFPVGALKFSFDTDANQKGDKIRMFFNKNKIIGVITQDVVPPTAWSAQNYTEGQSVTQDHTVGSNTITFTYTCIANTVSNDPPRNPATGLINTDYWQKGLRIALTADQIARINDGFMAKLTTNPMDPEGTGEYLGEITKVDATNNYIYVANIQTEESSPLTTTFYAATPTYFATGYQMVGDCCSGPFEINSPWHRQYGDDKIGAAIIPEETVVRIEYVNVDGASGKRFVGEVEVLRGSGTHQI